MGSDQARSASGAVARVAVAGMGIRGGMYASAARADLTDRMLRLATERCEHPATIGVTVGGSLTSPLALMCAEFVRALADRRDPPCPPSDGLLSMAAIAAIHTGIQTHRAVEVRV